MTPGVLFRLYRVGRLVNSFNIRARPSLKNSLQLLFWCLFVNGFDFSDHTPLNEVSYVVIQHLWPNHQSRLAELLARHGKHPSAWPKTRPVSLTDNIPDLTYVFKRVTKLE